MRRLFSLSIVFVTPLATYTDLRLDYFKRDPLRDGLNEFSTIGMRPVVQDFGYRTTNCNATPGEIGGTVSRPDRALFS